MRRSKVSHVTSVDQTLKKMLNFQLSALCTFENVVVVVVVVAVAVVVAAVVFYYFTTNHLRHQCQSKPNSDHPQQIL